MTEQWRPIAGYEGRYEVSDDGSVWSLIRHCRMTPVLMSAGYLSVGLRLGGARRTHCIHRLVAEAFLPPRPSYEHEVCHIDGNPLNNAAENLRWGTRADNMRDAVRHGTHHQSSKTHCKRGHEFTPENTIPTGPGHRRCRTCTRVTQAAYNARKASA